MEGSKKLAILILAHKNLGQLKRLVLKLNNENADIFIHIDKKWNLKNDEIISIKELNKTQIFICENRISAFLDKWSLVEAIMEIIRTAKWVENKKKKVKYHYFALLSGQDYPIKPMTFIINLLSSAYPKPFIDCTPFDKKNWLKKKFKSLPVENDIRLWFRLNMKPGVLRKGLKLPLFIYISFLKLFIPTPFIKLKKLKCELFGGSAWWILPNVVIDEVYKKFFESSDLIVNILSKTFTPEETFFQIMTMQSKVAPLVEINDKKDIRQNCLTYAHFRDEGKPFTGHPYILLKDDFNKLKNLPHLFARKFDNTVDSEILQLIDEYLINNKLVKNIWE
jgi:hypothetical protein